jgi:hypothetical protein
MGTGSFLGVKYGRSVTLTTHPPLVPRSKNKNRALPLLSLRAFVAYGNGETYLPTLFHKDKQYVNIDCMFSFSEI